MLTWPSPHRRHQPVYFLFRTHGAGFGRIGIYALAHVGEEGRPPKGPRSKAILESNEPRQRTLVCSGVPKTTRNAVTRVSDSNLESWRNLTFSDRISHVAWIHSYGDLLVTFQIWLMV